jgi:hypothetical protein
MRDPNSTAWTDWGKARNICEDSQFLCWDMRDPNSNWLNRLRKGTGISVRTASFCAGICGTRTAIGWTDWGKAQEYQWGQPFSVLGYAGPEQQLAHREENQLTLLHQKFRFQVWRQLPPAGLSKLPRARKEVSGTVVGQGPWHCPHPTALFLSGAQDRWMLMTVTQGKCYRHATSSEPLYHLIQQWVAFKVNTSPRDVSRVNKVTHKTSNMMQYYIIS